MPDFTFGRTKKLREQLEQQRAFEQTRKDQDARRQHDLQQQIRRLEDQEAERVNREKEEARRQDERRRARELRIEREEAMRRQEETRRLEELQRAEAEKRLREQEQQRQFHETAAREAAVENARQARLRVVSPDAIRRLRQLMRERYRLDIDIWNKRGVLNANQEHVIDLGEKSDAVLQEIYSIVESWDQSLFNGHPREWEIASRIKDQLAARKAKVWQGSPPWNDPDARSSLR